MRYTLTNDPCRAIQHSLCFAVDCRASFSSQILAWIGRDQRYFGGSAYYCVEAPLDHCSSDQSSIFKLDCESTGSSSEFMHTWERFPTTVEVTRNCHLTSLMLCFSLDIHRWLELLSPSTMRAALNVSEYQSLIDCEALISRSGGLKCCCYNNLWKTMPGVLQIPKFYRRTNCFFYLTNAIHSMGSLYQSRLRFVLRHLLVFFLKNVFETLFEAVIWLFSTDGHLFTQSLIGCTSYWISDPHVLVVAVPSFCRMSWDKEFSLAITHNHSWISSCGWTYQ